MSTEELKELTLTFKANKSTLEKWPSTLLFRRFIGSLSRKGAKVAFLKDGKEQTSRHYGDLRNLRNSPRFAGTSGKASWQLCNLASQH